MIPRTPPRYLRFVRSVALMSGVVLGGCGDRSHIPVGATGDASADADAGPCQCPGTAVDAGLRACGDADPPCAVTGPLLPPELPVRRRV